MPAASVPGRRRRPVLSMTPMIDVVFLLIIFFMTSQFRRSEGELFAQLPEHPGRIASAAPTKLDRKRQVLLQIAWGAGDVVYAVNGEELRGLDVLRTRLEGLLDAVESPWVIVLPGDDVPFGYVIAAFDTARAVGYEEVHFAPPDD